MSPPEDDAEMLRILRSHLGCTVKQRKRRLHRLARIEFENVIPQSMMESMRSSVLFMGALLARCGLHAGRMQTRPADRFDGARRRG